MDVVKDSAAALPASNEDVSMLAAPQPAVGPGILNGGTEAPPAKRPTSESVRSKQEDDDNQGEKGTLEEKGSLGNEDGGASIGGATGEEPKDGGQNNDGDEDEDVDDGEEKDGEKDDASVVNELSQEDFYSTLHEDMLEALDSINSPGMFAALHRLEKGSIPPVFVEGVGTISMPLGDAQAQAIIAQAKQGSLWQRQPDFGGHFRAEYLGVGSRPVRVAGRFLDTNDSADV